MIRPGAGPRFNRKSGGREFLSLQTVLLVPLAQRGDVAGSIT
jgi:hypothetical protein